MGNGIFFISWPAMNFLFVPLPGVSKHRGGQKRRYETVLPPGCKSVYTICMLIFSGENGRMDLRLMFRDRYLYDLEKFDNSLYERKDLAWIKESYLIILQMAWDREFYDRSDRKIYIMLMLLRKELSIFGNIDVFGIWPTWPRLGLDQTKSMGSVQGSSGRNSTAQEFCKNVRSVRIQDFLLLIIHGITVPERKIIIKGMARLIAETEADGVVLDTRGSSSY